MRIVPQRIPAPRLLVSLAPEVREQLPEGVGVRPQANAVPVVAGNGRGVFLAFTLGIAVLCGVGLLYKRQPATRPPPTEKRKLVAVSTQSITPPEPIVIKITADLIHVTAISLGHPRLAIINGRQVGEGEQITIHTPSAHIAVTLRVLKISDGRIELSDGTQVITARLEIPPPLRPKR